MISDLFTLVNWAFASSLLILLVLLLRRTNLRKKLSRTLCYALWLPVLLRLLLPMQMISLPVYPHIFQSSIVREATTEIDPTNIPQDSTPSVANRPTNTERVPTNGLPAMTSPTSPIGEETPERVTDTLSRSDLVLLVWRVGAITLAAAIAASNLLFTAKLRRCRVPLAGVSCALPVYTVEGLGSPCLAGVFRPAVYLSSDDARNAQRLRHIVAHEESHFRGGDHIWSVLRAAALCLHWYDPLVWYAVVVSKRDAELACDERTLRRIGGAERAAYGETLLSLTMAKPSARDLLSCSTAMVSGKKTLRERIEGIAHSRQTRAAAAFFVIVVLIFALLLAFGKQREVGEYERFIERVEAAECIAYHPTGIGTGEASVNCGIDLWNFSVSPDCASLVKVFLLTAGKTHDYLIPSRFCDFPASERAKLGAVLDGCTVTQASDFLRAVADHLAQYPTYHGLTAEALYAELPDKYKDFAPVLAAEPLWTGEAGDGRFALYDYGKREWALLYETGDVREIVTTYHRDLSDPNDSITAFVMDDLLGFPGVAVQSDAVGAHKSYDYYAWTDYGVQYVGYSFGFYDTPAECTFSVDFDGDGRSELITNNTYGGDGAERVTVFHWNGAASEVGSPDWSRVGVTLDGIGAMNYHESYDAARGVVTLSYRRGEEIKSAELPLTPENFMWLVTDEL